jgi:dihydroorotase
MSPVDVSHRFLPSLSAVVVALPLLLTPSLARAQAYELLIKHGRVIDPGNRVDGPMDVAIAGDRIARVAADIPATQARRVIDATGLVVTPGLIDLHTHVFVGGRPEVFADGSFSVSADDFSFRSGVTTVVDAGTSGWRNFPTFKTNVIDKSQTRILAFLSVAGSGMSGKPAQEDLGDMDARLTASAIRQYPEVVVGVKIGHYEGKDWAPFDRAVEAAGLAGVPLLVECHLPQYPLEAQLGRMRPGDIITHSFEEIADRMPVVDEQGHLRPLVLEAKRRGILFDVGHGGYGFWFSQAIPALRQGLAPNTFGTDLHRFSMNSGMNSMANLMSKYLNLGLELEDVIRGATWNAAQAIHRRDLGGLTEAGVADVAVFRVVEGNFGFVDAGGNRIRGTRKLEAEVTIRAGKVVWDLNGLAARDVTGAR